MIDYLVYILLSDNVMSKEKLNFGIKILMIEAFATIAVIEEVQFIKSLMSGY